MSKFHNKLESPGNDIGTATETIVTLAVEAGGRNCVRGDHKVFCAPCSYCGNWFRLKFLDRDHVIPLRKGGPNKYWNLRLSCRVCNQGREPNALGDALKRGHLSLLMKHFQSYII